MAAPKFDKYGMHAESCECPRCLLGFRPTPSNRWAARAAWERAEARKAAEREAAAKAKGAKPAPKVRLSQWERDEASRKQTDETIARLAAPVVRPATEEELAALRAEFGFKPRKKRP